MGTVITPRIGMGCFPARLRHGHRAHVFLGFSCPFFPLLMVLPLVFATGIERTYFKNIFTQFLFRSSPAHLTWALSHVHLRISPTPIQMGYSTSIFMVFSPQYLFFIVLPPNCRVSISVLSILSTFGPNFRFDSFPVHFLIRYSTCIFMIFCPNIYFGSFFTRFFTWAIAKLV